ncbi:MAG: glycosyltransferase, partial [Sphingomonadaceae bacterium]
MAVFLSSLEELNGFRDTLMNIQSFIADTAPANERKNVLQLAIILPTLNERDNIAPLIERIEDALGPEGWEVLVVDDNSKDGT